MTSQKFLLILAAAAVAGSLTGQTAAQSNGAGASIAQVAVEPYAAAVSHLTAEGFRVIEIRRTLLGRLRILAVRNGVQREIVVSRSTGEILRDVMLSPNGGFGASQSGGGTGAPGTGGASGGLGGADSGSGGAVGDAGGAAGGAVGDVGDAVGDAVDGLGGALGL